MEIKKITLIALAVMLTGCAQINANIKKNQEKAQREATRKAAQAKTIEKMRPVCSSDEQCSSMWDAAQLWIVDNAGYRLALTTDVVLQTFAPGGSDLKLRAKAVKEPIGGDEHRITVKLWCGNIFGCDRDLTNATIEFYRVVNKAGES